MGRELGPRQGEGDLGGPTQAQGKLVWRGLGREVQLSLLPAPGELGQDGCAGVLSSDGVTRQGSGLELFSRVSPGSLSDPQHHLLLPTQHGPSLKNLAHPYLAAHDGSRCPCLERYRGLSAGPGGRWGHKPGGVQVQKEEPGAAGHRVVTAWGGGPHV